MHAKVFVRLVVLLEAMPSSLNFNCVSRAVPTHGTHGKSSSPQMAVDAKNSPLVLPSISPSAFGPGDGLNVRGLKLPSGD